MKKFRFISLVALAAIIFTGGAIAPAYAADAAALKTTIEGKTWGTNVINRLAAAVNGNTVTVTGTYTSDGPGTGGLTLDIDEGVTVVWKANVVKNTTFTDSYLIRLTGNGTFEVAEGGTLDSYTDGIRLNGNTTKVNLNSQILTSHNHLFFC